MPIYEYECQKCHRKVTHYLATFTDPDLICPHCKGKLKRLFSSFAMRKGDQAIYEDVLGDSKLRRGMMGDDPRALAEWNRRMTRGEKVAPEYEEAVGRMTHGESPMPPPSAPPPEPRKPTEKQLERKERRRAKKKG